ncbi:MAG: hypothetical protein IJJ48_07565 [Firmicutes bacterium]|nr:hypothetical protein [Bacillota bacterium]
MSNQEKEGFTLGLALMDAIPVVAFGVDMALLAKPLGSKLFLLGAIISLLAGACMVVYKLLLATVKKEVPGLKKMMPIGMTAGWVMMIAALILNRSKISLAGIWHAVSSMPACIFFVLGIAFFAAFIIYFKTKFNADSAKDNWIEEILNAGTQVFILIGVVLSVGA